MNAILKGSCRKCLEHLLGDPGEDLHGKCKKIADFIGVSELTVRRWFDDSSKPLGESLVCLWFYLEHQGYQVEELESMQPVVRTAAQICAFGILSFNEAATLVGYPSNGRIGIDMILRVFRGKTGVQKKRLQELTSLVTVYGEKLPEKQQATPKLRIVGSAAVRAPSVRESMASIMKPGLKGPLQEREVIIESLAGSVKALIPLARVINSDEYTAEERARLRELAGGDGVFVLANLLFRLCGERSRQMHSNQQHSATSKREQEHERNS